VSEAVIRESLMDCGHIRRQLAAQSERLRGETRRALREAHRLGSPTLSLAEAARLAGVSRSIAYSQYLTEREGDDDADRSRTTAVEDRAR
jgi:hypothetical protein